MEVEWKKYGYSGTPVTDAEDGLIAAFRFCVFLIIFNLASGPSQKIQMNQF